MSSEPKWNGHSEEREMGMGIGIVPGFGFGFGNWLAMAMVVAENGPRWVVVNSDGPMDRLGMPPATRKTRRTEGRDLKMCLEMRDGQERRVLQKKHDLKLVFKLMA